MDGSANCVAMQTWVTAMCGNTASESAVSRCAILPGTLHREARLPPYPSPCRPGILLESDTQISPIQFL